MARDYKREYALYGGKPEQIKRRALRNAARRMLMKEGRVRKGDGKDVDHITKSRTGPLNNSRSNLRVMSASANRSRK
jgi:hypothetical protein